jgi:hypothetical protein
MVGLAHIPSPSRQREGNRHKPSCMLMSLKCGEQNMGDTGGESHMEVFQHEAKHFFTLFKGKSDLRNKDKHIK